MEILWRAGYVPREEDHHRLAVSAAGRQQQLTHVRRTWTEVTGTADSGFIGLPALVIACLLMWYKVGNLLSMKQNFAFGLKEEDDRCCLFP